MASNDNSENSARSQLVGSDIDSLYGVIDKDKVYGLNLTVPEDAKAVVKPWEEREDTTLFAESNVDDQLILHIPFTQNVRVKSILVKLGRGEVTPRQLRIYANHPTIVDFAEAEVITPQLNLALLEESGVTEYPLRVAAFANVNTLSLFFNESTGGEMTRIYYVGFKGDARTPRKEANSKMVVPAANAADARITDRVLEKAGAQQTTAR
ncbi:DUF1000-domain-containing protein [Gloeophyllum trabeum ATCC 11539]|uniref:DUF1000-domain-containing protein n=1 Tax=Gloeophyllum trabeum (strain ATCC 11539 / FP-39264 / Madison 617) TaxID=670483 RepID=S7PXC4_GLOTA|nr:DUF1000-domain-containing protein [Gloeophyllum trabeum ATCC 11539]EPQ52158.1 DUF1000-domain-containing protein [Gloeophyllum trabeum ATCC 11539]